MVIEKKIKTKTELSEFLNKRSFTDYNEALEEFVCKLLKILDDDYKVPLDQASQTEVDHSEQLRRMNERVQQTCNQSIKRVEQLEKKMHDAIKDIDRAL